jgi:LacI family transcriptional regulator
MTNTTTRPRRYQKTTIQDVADHANVSITTVSLYLKGKSTVCSADTATRIDEAIASLHYTPGTLNSSKRGGSTSVIGLSVINPVDDHNHPFGDRIWRGVNHEAGLREFAVMGYPPSVRDSLSHLPFLDGRIDGLILSGSGSEKRVVNLVKAGMPTVLLTSSRNIPEGCGAVYLDEAEVVDLAMEHLWELGHRNIAHLAGPIDKEAAALDFTSNDIATWRCDAYAAWMSTHGVPKTAIAVAGPKWDAPNVQKIMETWYASEDRPTAIFCANDLIAMEAIRCAEELDWLVPDELSIVGVDNDDQDAMIKIPLTTVASDLALLGREAVRVLAGMMDGEPASQICLPVSKLICRQSTARVKTIF